MPHFNFFGIDSDKNSTSTDLNKSADVSPVISNKSEIVESKESPKDAPDDAFRLDHDKDFIAVGENLEISIAASMKKYGDKTLAILNADLDKISNLKDREERAYRILEEQEGLKKIPVPDVKYANHVYDLIFDKIAKKYAKDESYVESIKIAPGVRVPIDRAEILPSIFDNFPNILNNQPIKEEDRPRPCSPWGF